MVAMTIQIRKSICMAAVLLCTLAGTAAAGQLDLVDVIQVSEDENFSPAGLAIGNDSRTIIVSSEDSKKLYRFQIIEE